MEGLETQIGGPQPHRLELVEPAALDDRHGADVGVDLAGAGGEVDLGGPGDPELDAPRLLLQQVVGEPQGAVRAQPDSALGAVVKMDPDRGDAVEVGDPVRERRPHPGSHCAPKERGVNVASSRIPFGCHWST